MLPKTCQSMDFTQFELSKLALRNLNKFKLSPTAKLVLLALVDKYPKIFPSQVYISNELGIGIASVKRAISELSKLGLVIYETQNVNNYKFTNIFFGILELIPRVAQNDTKDGIKMIPKEIKKEKNKKRDFKNPFSYNNKQVQLKELPQKNSEDKPRKYHSDCHIKGMDYPKYKPEKVKIGSPLDMTEEQATRWLNGLPKFLEKSFFATEVRKKWGIECEVVNDCGLKSTDTSAQEKTEPQKAQSSKSIQRCMTRKLVDKQVELPTATEVKKRKGLKAGVLHNYGFKNAGETVCGKAKTLQPSCIVKNIDTA